MWFCDSSVQEEITWKQMIDLTEVSDKFITCWELSLEQSFG